jgi:hypothetical protein
MRPVLLFLDFDGVLHPAGCDTSTYFCHREQLEAVLREHPNVALVIASTWRHAYPLNELKRHFSPDIAGRIVGKTPTWETEDDEHIRYREILKFLENPKVAGLQWIALDDSAFEFPPDCGQLVLCESSRGFDAQTAALLTDRLKRLNDAP